MNTDFLYSIAGTSIAFMGSLFLSVNVYALKYATKYSLFLKETFPVEIEQSTAGSVKLKKIRYG
jgi:hypothetical protein